VWRTKTKHRFKAEDTLQKSIIKARVTFEKKLICDLPNPHKVYRYIRNIIENKSMPQTLYFDTKWGNNDSENVNLFNEFFYSDFTRNSKPIYSNNLTSDTPNPLTEVEFTDYDVYNILANLDASKTVGINGIGPRVLKKCALPLCYPLHVLFTKYLDQCAILSDWAVQIVIPVHKLTIIGPFHCSVTH